MADYNVHPRIEKEIRATTYGDMLDEIKRVCSYITEDGYVEDVQPLIRVLNEQDMDNIDTEKLREAADRYYEPVSENGTLMHIRPQYEKIAGYLQCICTTIRYIGIKQRMDADRPKITWPDEGSDHNDQRS